jgi:hypothetical protein
MVDDQPIDPSTRVCPECGNPPGSQGAFCASCGTNLARTQRLPSRGEWLAAKGDSSTPDEERASGKDGSWRRSMRWWTKTRLLVAGAVAVAALVIVVVIVASSGAGKAGVNPIRAQEALNQKYGTSSEGLSVTWECTEGNPGETWCSAHWAQPVSHYALSEEYPVKNAGAGCFRGQASGKENLRKEGGLPETIEACTS